MATKDLDGSQAKVYIALAAMALAIIMSILSAAVVWGETNQKVAALEEERTYVRLRLDEIYKLLMKRRD